MDVCAQRDCLSISFEIEDGRLKPPWITREGHGPLNTISPFRFLKDLPSTDTMGISMDLKQWCSLSPTYMRPGLIFTVTLNQCY